MASVNYRVFARKYRPQTFDQVVGQDHITQTLKNAIRDKRVAQAYLLVGPRGIGKTSTARILAKALNCASGPTSDPCGECASCREIAEGTSLDVIEIDGASNNSVDNIRDLRESAAYSPARGAYKIYLIDEVHMLSQAAFNALLKTLEEPPPHVKFLFATTEAQKVPATITSRCQRFDLRRIPADAIAGHLQFIAESEGIALEAGAAEAIARAAEGGLRDAESMLDQAVAYCGNAISEEGVMAIFGIPSKQVISDFVEKTLAHEVSEVLGMIASQAAAGKDLSRFLSDATSHLRDLLVQGVSSDAPARRGRLLKLLDHYGEVEQRMRWAPDKKLQLDVAAIKAIHLLEQAGLDEVLEALQALKTGGPPPPSGRPAEARQKSASAQPSQKPPPPASPTAKKRPPSEETTVDASVAWERAAADFAHASPMSQWVSQGVFQEVSGNRITVGLPRSCAEYLDSVVGERAHKEAEAKLSSLLGKPTKLRLVVNDNLPDPEVAEPQAEIESPPEPVHAPEPPAPIPAEETKPDSSRAENFKNDPLIQKALETFAAEIRAA